MTELLNCTGLSKAYGKKRALDHVDLTWSRERSSACWGPTAAERLP